MNTWRSRVRALAGTLAAGLLLCGCWRIAPIEKTGLVTLLAIDAAPMGGYQVTAAIIGPQGASSAPGVGGQNAAVLLRQTSSGSVAEAIRKLSTISYLALDFAHLEAVLVSEQLARAGLATPLDYLASTPEVVATPWLLIARGQSAASILQSLQKVKPRPDEVVIDTVSQGRARTPYYAEHLFTFLKEIQLYGDEPTTAGVTVEMAPGGATTAGLRLTGEALFRRDRLVGWLDGNAARGWLVATGRAHNPMIVVPTPTGNSTLELLGARRRIRVTHGPQGLKAELDLQVAARLVATQKAPANFWHAPDLVTTLRAATVTVLTRDALTAVHAAQHAGADVFGLGEYVRVSDPAAWNVLKDRWNEVGFTRLPVAVHVLVAFHSLGESICPILGGCASHPPSS